jgi:hypothetical protein
VRPKQARRQQRSESHGGGDRSYMLEILFHQETGAGRGQEHAPPEKEANFVVHRYEFASCHSQKQRSPLGGEDTSPNQLRNGVSDVGIQLLLLLSWTDNRCRSRSGAELPTHRSAEFNENPLVRITIGPWQTPLNSIVWSFSSDTASVRDFLAQSSGLFSASVAARARIQNESNIAAGYRMENLLQLQEMHETKPSCLRFELSEKHESIEL